jgi:hypothetical protein
MLGVMAGLTYGASLRFFAPLRETCLGSLIDARKGYKHALNRSVSNLPRASQARG